MIYDKLRQVQAKLNVPKKQYNEFSNFNYRSCEDILEAAKPALSDVGAVLTVGDKLVQIGDRYYIEATAHFIDCDDGTEITNVAYAREPDSKKGMDSSQVTGATSSYARKYALNGLFCLDDVRDADTMDNRDKNAEKPPSRTSKPKETPKEPPLTENYVQVLYDQLKRTGVGLNSLLKNYGVNDVHNLSTQQWKDAVEKLKKKPDAPSADEEGLPWA